MASIVTKQIIEQLKDNSHPSIVLLDGDWGIGKTHLIENELKPLVENDEGFWGEFHYLSAYGLSTVTEFQDQVASLYLANNTKGSSLVNNLLQHVSSAAQVVGADKSEAGLVQGLASGLSGMVRQGALKNLKDMTIVLDDLERINNKGLIVDILGTCLRFAEQNKLKVIVVANSAAIEDLSKIEKTFSDVIKLTRNTDELISILKESYGDHFCSIIEKALTVTIESVKRINPHINNLRVLKRIVNRILKLYERIKDITGVDKEASLELLSHQIAGICLYSYGKEYKEIDMVNFFEKCIPTMQAAILANMTGSQGGNSISPDKELVQKEFDIVFGRYYLTNGNPTIPFCFNNLVPQLSDDEIINQFALPRLMHPIDRLSTNLYSLTYEEFDTAVDALDQLLFNTENADYYEWVSGCDTYYFLAEHNYIDISEDQALKKLFERLGQEKVIDPSSLHKNESFRRRLRLSEGLRSEEFKAQLQKYINEANVIKEEEFVQLFYTDWQTAISENTQEDYTVEPLFHNFDISKLAKSIAKWSPTSINDFIIFIKKRNSTSYSTRDNADLSCLKELCSQLDEILPKVIHRLVKGVLTELRNELQISVNFGDEAIAEGKAREKAEAEK
jgi:hypothetical protein